MSLGKLAGLNLLMILFCFIHRADGQVMSHYNQGPQDISLRCDVFNLSLTSLSHLDTLAISRLVSGERHVLASLSSHCQQNGPVSHVQDGEASGQISSVGFPFFFLQIRWSNAQHNLDGNYQCEVYGANSDFKPVSTKQELKLQVQKGEFLFFTTPAHISVGLSPRLDIYCSITDANARNTSIFESLTIFRIHEGVDQILANIKSGHDVSMKPGADGDFVKGSLDSNEGFILMGWNIPGMDQAGVYICEATGINASGDTVSLSRRSNITWQVPSSEALVSRLKEMSRSKVDLENRLVGMNRTKVDLENRLVGMNHTKVDLENLLVGMNHTKVDLENRLEKMNQTKVDSENDLVKMKKTKADLENRLVKMNQTKADLENRLVKMNQTKDDMENRLVEVNQTKEDLENRLVKMNQTKGDLENRLEQMNHTKVDLENRLEKMNQTKVDSEHDLVKMKKTKADLENRLLEVNQTKADLENSLEQMNQTKVDSENRLVKMKKNKADLENRLLEMNQTKADLERRLDKAEHLARDATEEVARINKNRCVRSCDDLTLPTGQHEVMLFPDNLGPIKVSCDVRGPNENWKIFQKRFDGSVDFYRNFSEYENGFGSVHGEHWLGLKHIKRLLDASGKNHELRVDMVLASNGTRYTRIYPKFSIGPGDTYTLTVAGYDDRRRGMSYNNRAAFSTYDHGPRQNYANQDRYSTGWWFRAGGSYVNLNGVWGVSGKISSIYWREIGNSLSAMLSATEMKFRSRN